MTVHASRLLVVAAVVAAGLACGSSGPPPPSAPSPLVAKSIPEFTRPALDGTRVDTKDLRGKVVVLKFFAKYCEPCVRTLPATQALHQSYGSSVAFVGVAVDELREDVQSMIDTYSLTFPIVCVVKPNRTREVLSLETVLGSGRQGDPVFSPSGLHRALLDAVSDGQHLAVAPEVDVGRGDVAQ